MGTKTGKSEKYSEIGIFLEDMSNLFRNGDI